MSFIIKVEDISKEFIIGHENVERYTTLRDEISKRTKKLFSFPFSNSRKRVQSVNERNERALTRLTFCQRILTDEKNVFWQATHFNVLYRLVSI